MMKMLSAHHDSPTNQESVHPRKFLGKRKPFVPSDSSMAQRHKRTAVVFVLVLFFCSTANAQAEVPSLEVHAKGTGADAGLAASTSSSSDAASQPGGVMKPHVATLAGPPLAHPPPPAPHPAALPRPRFRNLYLIRHGEAAKNTCAASGGGGRQQRLR